MALGQTFQSHISVNEDDFIISPDDVMVQSIGDGVENIKPLTQDQVKGIISMEIQDSLGGLGSQISEQRRKAIRYYYARPFGNEQEGRSQVQLTEVADTIEWIMPHLMRMFVGTGVVFKFNARTEKDEAFAQQASDVINKVFMEDCDGFQILQDWFKTALLEKNGIVKPVYEETFEPIRATYRGVTVEQIGAILSADQVELTAVEAQELDPALVDLTTGQPIQTYDISTLQKRTIGKLKVYGVPPEEYLHARRAITLDDDTPFSAHRQKVTVSDLIALGYPAEVVATLPSDDTPEFTQGRTERLSEDETWPIPISSRSDGASRELWVTDCYIRIDEDGDGYAELRRILAVGENTVTILDDYEVTQNPFCSLTPIPMPHKFFGQSIADQTMDLQLIGSTLLRQMFDNIYLTNNSRYEVVEGMVEMDDLLTSRPGGVVRVQQQGSVTPMPTPPLPRHAWEMLEYLEGVQEKRTGVSAWQQGPDASDLKNQTADATTKVMKAAYSKIEHFARIFAETGVKDLGKKLLRLMVENNTGPFTMKLRGEWVQVDPSLWNANMDCTVEVGMGVGAANERLVFLEQIAEKQRALVDAGMTNMVQPKHIHNTLMSMQEAMGMRRDDRFFADPGSEPFPERQPPLEDQVKMKEHERRVADDKYDNDLETAKLAVEADKNQDLQEYRAADLAQKGALEVERLAQNERIELRRIDATVEAAMANASNGGTSQ